MSCVQITFHSPIPPPPLFQAEFRMGWRGGDKISEEQRLPIHLTPSRTGESGGQ